MRTITAACGAVACHRRDHTCGMDADGAGALLKEILHGALRLPGASCVGRHRVYDPVVGHGQQHQRQEQNRVAEAGGRA
ncbi:MAG: hypothetical protein ACRDRO_27980 [Pseudonocardiaceae bacterium]